MKEKRKMKFKYERKRIKSDKKLPPACLDYVPESGFGSCSKANLCKNATYGWEGKAMGTCFGGTRVSEIEARKNSV